MAEQLSVSELLMLLASIRPGIRERKRSYQYRQLTDESCKPILVVASFADAGNAVVNGSWLLAELDRLDISSIWKGECPTWEHAALNAIVHAWQTKASKEVERG